MIIHTPTKPRSKKRKPTAKQRELAASWEALVKRYEPKKPLPKVVQAIKPQKAYVRETPHYPSLNSGYHDCTKKRQEMYTGTAMIGIGTLHKSNAVPVFSSDDAKEISRMRRG
jgi:hypothetical protein